MGNKERYGHEHCKKQHQNPQEDFLSFHISSVSDKSDDPSNSCYNRAKIRNL